MGQRLNIEIQDNEQPLANAYYHWSGYTSTSLELTELIINSPLINDEFLQAIPDKVQFAVELLKLTGAGYTDRNEGLIGTSESDMAETRKWQEAGIIIDIGAEMVYFDNFYYIENEDLPSYNVNLDKIPHLMSNLESCSFDEFNSYFTLIKDLLQTQYTMAKTPNGIVGFIA